MLFSTLWAYWTKIKTTIGFTPFHLVHKVDVVLLIECEIPTLQTTVKLLMNTTPLKQCLISLETLYKDRHSSLQNNEASKKCTKDTFNHHVNLRSFNEGDLVLSYDITQNTLGHGKFESLLCGPFIIKHFFKKGEYTLSHPKITLLKDPFNGLYLKRFYP
jgi:hypothetical protein